MTHPWFVRSFWGGLALAGALATPLQAQQTGGTISGRVTDRGTGGGLADARVYVTGTTLETMTNAAGEYRLVNIRPGRAQLGVLRIGYRASSDTLTVTVGQNVTKDFSLVQTLTTLTDVVVTGTVGNQERRAQPATVSSVSATDVKAAAAITTVGEMLQSRVSGVSVSSSSGTAGGSRTIRVRGPASISLANRPLVFIDGVRMVEASSNMGIGGQVTDRLNDLNPDDIESIEIVKGPAAATLYGADASTGVIQIITKRGRIGTNSFQQTMRAEYGAADANWTAPDNYGACTAALVAATSVNPLCRGQAVGTLVRDNPLDRTSAFRTGSDQLLGWSGRGGGQNYGYFVSLGADRSLGVLPSNDFRRYSFRTNFNFVPTSRVTVEAGIQTLQSQAILPDNDNNIYGYLGGALLGSPLTRRDDGLAGQDGWFGFARQVKAIESIENEITTRRNILTASGTFLATPWWKNRLTMGADILGDEGTRYFPKNAIGQYAGLLNTGNNVQTRLNSQRYTVDYLSDLRGTYLSEGQLAMNLSLGAQAIVTRTDSVAATGQGFTTNSSNVIGSASTTTSNQQFNETRQVGLLSQLQASWRDRLFLQVGARYDDFSAFGAETDPILLPKVGASWVVSEEAFFQPLSSVFNSLRLRAAYGTTGRAPLPGASITTLAPAPSAVANGQNIIAEPGAIPFNPGNARLKPERGTEFEGGFDATVINDRVQLEVTYYDRISRDVLLLRPLPPSLGFQANPFANIGEVRNKGWEVAMNASLLRRRNFEWDTRLAMNTLDTKITSLGDVSPFGTLNRFTSGHQPGVWVSKRIQSINEQTGVVTVADTFEAAGNLWPTLEAGITNTVTLFKNLRLVALVDTKQDFAVYNLGDFFRETQVVRSNNRLDLTRLSARERLRRYGNPNAGQPAFVQQNGASTTVDEVRDAYLQPGDFVRFRELSATYTLPRSLTSKWSRAGTASIGLALQNVAIWTKYEGADPEVNSGVGVAAANEFTRNDFFTLPNPKRALLRVNLAF
ncbi:MAG: SusC/RagA family TonB-linked outer membrane protein [Cytophagaceae bacterium]|nr:SusC/RagA family TonB-linked outer membrane protein [Gemmatimonadaceae bacterium]